MDVEIGQLTSTVTPQVMQAIVRTVTDATKDNEAREQRAEAERRVTGGVSQERDEER
jgi:hypothetical protein